MHAEAMAHLCPHRRVLQQSIRPGACPHRQPLHRLSVRCRATIELPPDLQAVVNELEESKYCGGEGTVLVREPPVDVPKNGKRYHIHTFGCQMNLADSERMAGVLESVGYECSEDPAKADVLIYNTCSIREKAEVKVYSALGKQVRGAWSGQQSCTLAAAPDILLQLSTCTTMGPM
eukprot:GHRQ01017060.1.p1 GENE.GHRQ01017060.1~~GHRQ01017060.1.p1  ORF type:complete len:176 (+),score=28.64 GHRQ01017060.1:233-760(+)